jgi:hypothetical protein
MIFSQIKSKSFRTLGPIWRFIEGKVWFFLWKLEHELTFQLLRMAETFFFLSSCHYGINNAFFLGGVDILNILWSELPKRFKIPTILILYLFLKIKSQIKSLFLKLIFSQIKSSENDLKSDVVKSQIKSLNTLV